MKIYQYPASAARSVAEKYTIVSFDGEYQYGDVYDTEEEAGLALRELKSVLFINRESLKSFVMDNGHNVFKRKSWLEENIAAGISFADWKMERFMEAKASYASTLLTSVVSDLNKSLNPDSQNDEIESVQHIKKNIALVANMFELEVFECCL